MRLLISRKADAYAWFAALLVFIAIPLASLSIDVTRMMYVRGHLQTANDAACQSAADALDTALFVTTGRKRIEPGLARRQAAREFSATLRDAGKIRYTIEGLAIDFPGPAFAHCVATVHVDHLIPLTPKMRIVLETTSEMRVLTFP